MKTFLTGLFIYALLVTLPFRLSAAVIYDNGAPNDGASFYYADSGNSDGNQTVVGNIFTTGTGGIADSIEFAGNYKNGTPSSNSFTIDLYTADTSGAIPAPGTLIDHAILTDVSESAVVANGNSTTEFTGTLSDPNTLDPEPFDLAPSTSYFIDFSDATSPFEDFGVNTSDGSDPLYQTEEGSLAFIVDQSLSFDLFTSIPEPSTDAMLLAGLGVLVVALRRRCHTI
jgi:hypothetical protein